MNETVRDWSRLHTEALRKYLAHGDESNLQHAYELGRGALFQGLGVLDMARLHQEALITFLQQRPSNEETLRAAQAGETFFFEMLPPYEAAHRGFRDACQKLRQLNQTLEERNRALAAANAELEREVTERKRAEERLRRLSSRILQIQEEERKRISRELHDEVGQALTAAIVSLSVLEKKVARQGKALREKIGHTQRQLEATLENIHRFARELRPAMLDDLGLIAALRSYLRTLTLRSGLRIHFRADPVGDELDSDRKTALYRVAQESLTNVLRHAQAREAILTIMRKSDGVCMEIRDDGQSFDPDQLAAKAHQRLGLLGMAERVRLVNGTFTIEPALGQGTTVTVQVPFTGTSESP